MSFLAFALALPLLLVAFALLLSGFVYELVTRRRETRTRLVLGRCAMVVGGLVVVLLCGVTLVEWVSTRVHLGRIEQRALPIIDALRRFEAAEQRRPVSLDELVPGYLAEIPGTDWPDHPHFKYGGNESGTSGLYVEISELLSFDQFIYAPEKLPIETEGKTTRYDDWIYYDE